MSAHEKTADAMTRQGGAWAAVGDKMNQIAGSL
jgi:hypothetical protein